ncbi:DNA methyltransferase [Actinomadura sediminis]|uniref:DNA methyltransferase n=1 Tax=Actinomadura sediminis TaxID=1038904 RepID=A0ABW3ESN3_9ACTN
MSKGQKAAKPNRLFYGDNLHVLREHIATESVDLVYLDPPFNSNRSYNVLFKEKSGDDSPAQIEAFGDTWTWSQETEELYIELLNGSAPVAVKDALEAMRRLLGDNDVLAYLVMMMARLIELHRVLKPEGSLYLHCDPTASHYLKMALDSIFGPTRFRSEIIWKRTTAHSDGGQGRKAFGRVHDVILMYSKSEDWTWNPLFTPYDDEYVKSKYPRIEEGTGRRYGLWDMTGPGGAAKGNPRYEVMGVTRYWRYSEERMAQMLADGRVEQPSPGAVPRQKKYLDEAQGVPLQDVWTDIYPINSQAAERLGYPTQKPVSLLERIVSASSNPGDIVLDPFAGCGTSIDAAQKLGRRWVGIDITTIAVDLIDSRLRHTYGESIRDQYEVLGIPKDLSGARSLFERSPFEFERWCVMLLPNGQPNEKQVGDKGIDGVIRIPLDSKGMDSHKILISVKGGTTNPGHVRDLVGTVESERAAMGIFVCMKKPTKGMLEAAQRSGIYSYPVNKQNYPKVQIITVEELLSGKQPKMPAPLPAYFQAKKRVVNDSQQMTFM